MIGAIVLAAGVGRRMGLEGNKQYLALGEKSILSYSLAAMKKVEKISEIIVVYREGELDFAKLAVSEAEMEDYPIHYVVGGKERQDSVRLALAAAPKHWKKVIIHDGARPFVTADLISRVVEALDSYPGVIPGVTIADTIKTIDDGGRVIDSPRRSQLVAAQTPQGFHFPLILELHEKALENNLEVTDDASLLEQFGYHVQVIAGELNNKKITFVEDYEWAKWRIENAKNRQGV